MDYRNMQSPGQSSARRAITWRWLCYGALLLTVAPAAAHFGVVLPSDDMVMAGESRRLELQLMFMHPFTGAHMDMARPVTFAVRARGQDTDLLSTIRPVERGGHGAWETTYEIRRPGDHTFYVEPSPYFEAAEQSFIVHYTKVIVHALGMEAGWDQPVGLKTEIVPLTRPYGLWSGNVFRGQVLRAGQPLSHAEVEVELLAEGKVEAPADPFITQVVTADDDGVFVYGLPCAGWWGFAALSTDDEPRRHDDGKEYPVEIGAVLWIHAHDIK
jgi:cobalt/nickel transport protein